MFVLRVLQLNLARLIKLILVKFNRVQSFQRNGGHKKTRRRGEEELTHRGRGEVGLTHGRGDG